MPGCPRVRCSVAKVQREDGFDVRGQKRFTVHFYSGCIQLLKGGQGNTDNPFSDLNRPLWPSDVLFYN